MEESRKILGAWYCPRCTTTFKLVVLLIPHFLSIIVFVRRMSWSLFMISVHMLNLNDVLFAHLTQVVP